MHVNTLPACVYKGFSAEDNFTVTEREDVTTTMSENVRPDRRPSSLDHQVDILAFLIRSAIHLDAKHCISLIISIRPSPF